jgi:hypothetical protein
MCYSLHSPRLAGFSNARILQTPIVMIRWNSPILELGHMPYHSKQLGKAWFSSPKISSNSLAKLDSACLVTLQRVWQSLVQHARNLSKLGGYSSPEPPLAEPAAANACSLSFRFLSFCFAFFMRFFSLLASASADSGGFMAAVAGVSAFTESFFSVTTSIFGVSEMDVVEEVVSVCFMILGLESALGAWDVARLSSSSLWSTV